MYVIYELVTWFTDCPYFSLMISIFSIISFWEIIKTYRFRKGKPITPSSDAQKIVEKLILADSRSKIEWFLMSESPFADDTEIGYKTINFRHSFFAILDLSDYVGIYLITTSKDVRLYASLDFKESSPRLITTDKETPDLKSLASKLSHLQDMTNTQYSERIINRLESLL